MTFRTPNHRWREAEADYERSIGIPDREPIVDTRDVHDFLFRKDGGENWRAKPRPGMTSYHLTVMEAPDVVVFTGTLKQCLRWMSARMRRRLGARNLQ